METGNAGPSLEAETGILRQVTRGASAVAVPLVGGLLLSFALSVVLARWLGAAEFGIYAYVWSWVAVLSTASLFGLDNAVVRQLPVHASNATWGLVSGLLRWANGVTLLASLGLVALAVLARFLLVGGGQPLPSSILLIAGALVALTSLLRVQQAALRGLQRPGIGQVPESVVLPALMLGVVAMFVVTGSVAASAEHALLAQVAVASVALVAALWLVFRAIPDVARHAPQRYEHRRWLIASGRLLVLSSLVALNGRVGILLLGAVAGAQVVGPYSVALRGAGFISLALNVTVLAMAPTIAAAYSAGQVVRVRLIARQMSRIALIVGGPIAVILIVWGRSFLMLFGPGFEGASTALAILAAGEVVNIGAGPVATLLVMTGHERDAVLGLALGTAVNAGLCLILIPQWGINGAAVAAAASVMLWNVILWQFVRRRLTIAPSILGGDASTARSRGA